MIETMNAIARHFGSLGNAAFSGLLLITLAVVFEGWVRPAVPALHHYVPSHPGIMMRVYVGMIGLIYFVLHLWFCEGCYRRFWASLHPLEKKGLVVAAMAWAAVVMFGIDWGCVCGAMMHLALSMHFLLGTGVVGLDLYARFRPYWVKKPATKGMAQE